MVKLKFVIRNCVLALRISEGSSRYYKRMAHLMKDQPDLKHWKQDKEMFSGYAEFYKENNQILEDFKAIYWKLVKEHPELLAQQVACFYNAQRRRTGSQPVQLTAWGAEDYKNSVLKYLEVVVSRERAKQGCNYESYYKLLTRCRRQRSLSVLRCQCRRTSVEMIHNIIIMESVSRTEIS